MFTKVKRACRSMVRGAAVFLAILVAIALVGLWVETDDFYRKYVIPSVLSLGIAAVVWWRTSVTLRDRGFPQDARHARSLRNAFSSVPVAVLALSFAES